MAGVPEHHFLISGERAALGSLERTTGAVLIALGLRVAVERR